MEVYVNHVFKIVYHAQIQLLAIHVTLLFLDLIVKLVIFHVTLALEHLIKIVYLAKVIFISKTLFVIVR